MTWSVGWRSGARIIHRCCLNVIGRLPRLTELHYTPDSARRFQVLLDLPWTAFLDSNSGATGRYDILSAAPYATIVTRGAVTQTRVDGRIELSSADPLALLRKQLGSPDHNDTGLPFCGGAIGCFGYDLGRRFEQLPSQAVADITMPDMAVGLYDWAVVVDHEAQRSWLVGAGVDPQTDVKWAQLLALIEGPVPTIGNDLKVLSALESSFDKAAYAAAFHRIKAHIRCGDCYQINLTQRFEVRVQGHPWHAYRRLRELNPAPFSAYLGLPDGAILSSSPERFLSVRNGTVEAKPIKGTRARSTDETEDRLAAETLRSSAKDQAENVMIVDLLRNDLGKSCRPGSVQVSKLADVESFANVHHLVSTVTGALRSDKDALDLLRGAFPGGSITGAPKLRAMEIIDALEAQRRGVYCGSIGYMGFDGNMDLNIAIRTLVQHKDRLYAWAGGGIVADSDLDAEYQESLDKAALLLRVLTAADP